MGKERSRGKLKHSDPATSETNIANALGHSTQETTQPATEEGGMTRSQQLNQITAQQQASALGFLIGRMEARIYGPDQPLSIFAAKELDALAEFLKLPPIMKGDE